MSGTTTAAAPPTVTRTAPSGEAVALSLPDAFGSFRWFGNTRFVGPQVARQFFLAPAGGHRVIPTKILPGARESRRSFQGFDAVLYEAADRSDSALVLAGPHHEATTWFGGPAPADAGVAGLLAGLAFADSPTGASLRPADGSLVQQPDVSIIGRSADSVLVVRRAVDALPMLPEFAGLPVAGGELWRAGRVLDTRQRAQVGGTPHEWRYLVGGESAVLDLVMLGPESSRPATALSEPALMSALGGLAARWGA